MQDAIVTKASEQIEKYAKISPIVKAFFDETTCTASYVVHDPKSNIAAIIDSVLDYEPAAGRTSTGSADLIVDYATSNGLRVDWLLETHAHADHLSAAPYLQEKLGGKIAIGQMITAVQKHFSKLFNVSGDCALDGSQFDHLFRDGDIFSIGDLPVIALHVPGHTPADMAYIIGNVVFTGDTLFMPDYGTARTDFPGGDARDLYQSIWRILSLPGDTILYLCHDYKAEGRDDFVWQTDVKDQRENNIHIRTGVSENEFVAMRNSRDKTLDMPALILPSIQVNMRAGHFPAPEENGTTYLKIPMDRL